QPGGVVTTVASVLGSSPEMLVFDGSRVWTANFSLAGSISIVTPGATIPWTVTTVTSGAFGRPLGAIYDGSNVWITNNAANTMFRLDPAGAILQTVTVGTEPGFPVFDGSNIWVPLLDGVAVVRASSGTVLATLTGNGLNIPQQAAFDGQRVLLPNFNG